MSRAVSIITLVVALIVCAAIAFVLYASTRPLAQRDRTQLMPFKMVESLRRGDIVGALQSYNAVLSSATATPRQIARATRNAAAINFKQTGQADDVIAAIRTLKPTVVDTSVNLSVRVDNLNEILILYDMSNKNSRVFDEIFSTEPYSNYLVKGDGRSSIRNLNEWSYQLQPTPRAAISAAQSHVTAILDKDKSEMRMERRLFHLEQAEIYLKAADDSVAADSAISSDYTSSLRYAGFLSKRAYVIGALALLKGAPYDSQYKQVHEDFIDYLKSNDNVDMVPQYLAAAHWQYASFLVRKDEAAAADKEISAAVALADSDKGGFVERIRDNKPFRNDFASRSIGRLAGVSATFSAFLKTL